MVASQGMAQICEVKKPVLKEEMVRRKSNKNTDSFKAQQGMDKYNKKKKKNHSQLMLPKDLKGI